MSNKKLSEFMRRSLEAIRAQGGKAMPVRGGYWNGADGKRLKVEPLGNSVQDMPGTNTIRSLADRGHLEPIPDEGLPYMPAYRLKE